MKRSTAFVITGAAVACGLLVLTPAGPAVAQGMKPLLTLDVENPARQPFEQGIECNLDPGQGSCDQDVAVPSDKVLVVETITARTFVPIGQRAVVLVSNESTGVAHYLSLQLQGAFVSGQADALRGVHPIRVYVASGGILRFIISRSDNTGSGIFQASVSGHLVDCGAGPGCPIQ